MKMHPDEVHTDHALVRRLIAAQFPHWADLAIERVPSSGTDNALYRLGDGMVVRLPRIGRADGGIDKDLVWLPLLSRGAPLAAQDEAARVALGELRGMIDTDAASAAWEDALQTPPWPGAPVWIHGDLLAGNLLVQDGRLTGVIDRGCVGVGDPACDLIVAWNRLSPEARGVFRARLVVDDATWARGRGWALSIALIALPYHKDRNRGLAAIARHLIREVLADYHGGDVNE
jgi:aminoglycoside phosphotransferase (APT) family kinase protein